MKIRLTRNVPVGPEHNMTKGRELEVLRTTDRAVWVRGEDEDIKILPQEYEILEETE